VLSKLLKVLQCLQGIIADISLFKSAKFAQAELYQSIDKLPSINESCS
jgi:hypothetical protein